MIKKLLLTLLLLSISLYASEVKWAKDYHEGLKKAKELNKPIMFVSSRHTCKYCVILDNTTFKNAMITKELNDNFISIVAYSDEKDYMPQELWRPGTPAIWFLNSDGVPMFQPIMGAVGVKDFLNIVPQVKQEFQALQKKEKNDFYKLK